MPLRYDRVLVLTALLFTVSGCNDCTLTGGSQSWGILPWSDRVFTEIYSAGLTPARTSSCQASNGSAVLRVALRDSERAPITPDIFIGDSAVDFSRESISFASSALFELPNATCDADCSSGFSCVTPPAVNESSYLRCTRAEEDLLTVAGDPVFVSRTDRTQLFGVMLEQTGSWRGRLPTSITDLNPDLDGDGQSDPGASLTLQSYDNDRATDRQDRRINLARDTVTNWNDVRANAEQVYQTQSLFGLWTFGGSGVNVTSLIADLDSVPDDVEFIDSTGRTVAASLALDGNDGVAEQAAIYESMVTVLGSINGYASSEYADTDKILAIVVDGPDELRLPSVDAERVIAAANAIDARIFIVHVDTAVQTMGISTSTGGDIPLFPDDPAYYASQGEGFASEADCDCKNFEACRQPTRFSSTPDGPLDTPENPDAFYCVPDRGEDGRIGPIADYERIACATGGGYLYVPDVGRLTAQTSWLPYALDGLWEIPVEVALFANGSVASGEPFLIQTSLTIELGGDNNTYSHLPNPGANTPGDARTMLFSQ